MTVGLNSFECLQSLNHEAGYAAAAQGLVAVSTTSSNGTVTLQSSSTSVKTTAEDQSGPCIALPVTTDSSTLASTCDVPSSVAHSASSHSLGQLKRLMRAQAPRSGRNHAGAKYLASQYTKST